MFIVVFLFAVKMIEKVKINIFTSGESSVCPQLHLSWIDLCFLKYIQQSKG